MNKTPIPPTPARRPRKQRGSILILVVALLVLMALIGTAWISTARVDRTATILQTTSTQADLLIDGVVNTVRDRLVSDVSDSAADGGVHRGAGYVHTDSTVTDEFLAPRVPLFADEVAPVWTGTPPTGYNEPPVYYAEAEVRPAPLTPHLVSGRLVRIPSGPTSGRIFQCVQTHRGSSSKSPGGSGEWVQVGAYDLLARDGTRNPIFWASTTRVLPPDTWFEDITGQIGRFKRRTNLRVTSTIVNGEPHPGFEFYDTDLRRVVTIPAADVDGDGFPDANYFKLPVGRVNGLDWYAAVRIVDNSSAVNASVAFVPPSNPALVGAAFTPSSLNLMRQYPFGLLWGQNPQINDQQTFLNRARFNDVGADDFNQNPLTFGALRPATRADFAYQTIDQMMWRTLGTRLNNPAAWSDGGGNYRMKALPLLDAGALAYRGGTLINPNTLSPLRPPRSPLVPALGASSFIEQLLHETLFASADNHPRERGRGSQCCVPNRRRAQGVVPGGAVGGTVRSKLRLRARRRDPFPALGAPPNPTQNDPSTYPNFRAMMTVSNPVSNAVLSRLVPRNGNARKPGEYVRGRYEVGDYVLRTADDHTLLYVCINPTQATFGLPPGEMPINFAPENPGNVVSWEPRPFAFYPTKASVNAGSFGQLFLAFWQAMGVPTTVPEFVDPDVRDTLERPRLQSPLKDAYRATVAIDNPVDVDSPYWGGRFIAPAYGPAAALFPPYFDPTLGGAPDQNPLRMFRNPVRARPRSAGTGFDRRTPHLKTDQVLRLRAALAAVNAIDMRDGDDNVTFRDINLAVTLDRGTSVYVELPSDEQSVFGRTRVFGHEKQPFITEIFAHTDTTSTPNGMPGPNQFGYVAVELYNPYPFAIDLLNCKIATIDRRTPTGPDVSTLEILDPARSPTLAPNLAMAAANVSGAFPPTIIPPMGYLILENYREAGPVGSPSEQPPARYRPAGAGMTQTGLMQDPSTAPPPPPPGQPAQPVRNFAYVPNLHTVIDKEMVLVRPLNAVVQPNGVTIGSQNYDILRYVEPGTPTFAVEMAPLDSYDFTGMPNPDPAVGSTRTGLAEAWHYARPTGPSKEWRFVYPGRYDAHQSLSPLGARPRQQGTHEAAGAAAGGGVTRGWNPQMNQADPWDPSVIGGALPFPPPSLGPPTALAGPANATYFPYEYAIQLTNVQQALDGAAGPNPVRGSTGNLYPFGGYARNGDILQIPYMGSYRIKLSNFIAPPGRSTQDRSLPNHFNANQTNPAFHQVLEFNSITMDSVFAEDTDAENNANAPLALDFPQEQIGRFTPTILDLEVGAGGTVQNNTTSNQGMSASAVDDATRDEPSAAISGGTWAGYEMEIVAGPGKGQVRQVVSYTPGRMTVFPDWDTPLRRDESRYILRRGSRWRVTLPPVRSTANKFWASDLFDYVTVDSPQDDHFPAADPGSYARFANMVPPEGVNNTDPDKPAAITWGLKRGGGNLRIRGTDNFLNRNGAYDDGFIEYGGQVRAITGYNGQNREFRFTRSFNPPPPDGTAFRVFAKDSEDLTSTQGLININTAPWRVLAAIPWVLPADGTSNAPQENLLMAQAIAKYRDGDPSAGLAPHGPFRSIFDLYLVPEFAFHQNAILRRGGGLGIDPDDAQGDWTPPGTGTDGVRRDFEEQYLLLNRVSNMLTTRSDSFTCYVLVQGMRDGGTPNAKVVVQRRKAFVFDRTGVHEDGKDVSPQYFFNE